MATWKINCDCGHESTEEGLTLRCPACGNVWLNRVFVSNKPKPKKLTVKPTWKQEAERIRRGKVELFRIPGV
ncbi:MAG: hypothetical protein ACXABY_34265 [Candidatus Thorarchaeota archaeon]